MSKALDVCLILHADHGTNASTFTSLVVISTLSDMYSSMAAAIGALRGPLHGGANEGVMRMLDEFGDLLLCLIDPGDVLEGRVDLILAQQFRLALAERQRTATTARAALPLAHEEHDYRDHDE